MLEGMKDLAVLEAPDPKPRHHLNGGRGGSGVLLTPARRRAAIAHLTHFPGLRMVRNAITQLAGTNIAARSVSRLQPALRTKTYSPNTWSISCVF